MPVPTTQPAAVEQGGSPFDSPFGASSRLKAKAKPAFFLCHDPADWGRGVVQGRGEDGGPATYWLPNLHPHALRPGSAGVRSISRHEQEQGNHEAAYVDAKHTREIKGIVYLDPQTAVPTEFMPDIPDEYASLLQAKPGYGVRYPCTDPKRARAGFRWCELWDVPQPAIRGRNTRFSYDGEKFNGWRLWLVESGLIEPPMDHIVDENIARVARRVDRAAVHPEPAIRADKVDAQTSELENAEMAEIPEKVIEEPVKQPRKQRAASTRKRKAPTAAQKRAAAKKAEADKAAAETTGGDE